MFSTAISCVALLITAPASAEDALPNAKAVPDVQVAPLPNHEASFQYLDRELTRYYYSPALMRPFWFPIAGPAGRSLSRMGHPRDPQSHSHHNSVWISHDDVDGLTFWADRGTHPPGRIVHQSILDHPANPDHPTPFHVRDDGWMGVSLTLRRPLTIEPNKPLRLRYALWMHNGVPKADEVQQQWKAFAQQPLPPMTRLRK